MADEPEDAAPPSRKPNQWIHDWYPYHSYIDVHSSYMDRLADEGIVIHDHVSFIEIRQSDSLEFIQVVGRLECADNLVVSVNKLLEVRFSPSRRLEVRGLDYSYHAWTRNGCDVLRYDNAHGPLHRHAFDLRRCVEEGVSAIDLDSLPTLDEFVREAIASVRDANI